MFYSFFRLKSPIYALASGGVDVVAVVQQFEKLFGCCLGLHFHYLVGHCAGIVCDEGGAYDSHVFASGHLFLLPYAGKLTECGLCVGYKGKLQTEFVAEFHMARLAVLAHSDHLISHFLENFEIVAEVAGLGCAAGCIVLGIEVDDEVLAGVVGKSYLFSIGILAEQVGKFVAYIHGLVRFEGLYTLFLRSRGDSLNPRAVRFL